MTKGALTALVVVALAAACSGGRHTARRTLPTTATISSTVPHALNDAVRLVAASPELLNECLVASHAVGFAVPCPTRVVGRFGHPLACTRSPIPTSLPLCVGPEHDFFLEWNSFDVPGTFVGVDGKPEGHVIIRAGLVRDSAPRPCIGGVVIGSFVVLGSTGRIYRCPPDSPIVERTAVHGEGAYTSHVLLDWRSNGVDYLVSSHGYGAASTALMEQLAASLKLVTS